jgi:glutamine synthetase
VPGGAMPQETETHMTKKELLAKCKAENVRFVRLQFTELYGHLKNVQIPVEEISKALDNEMMFDGSSIRGYKRIEQSDMYFKPDINTFAVLPWLGRPSGNVARIICDVLDPDGSPFPGDPRGALKRQIAEAKKMGFTMNVGPEAEFFIFKRTEDGTPTVDPHDTAGYFDVGPMDKGENVRRAIEDTLVQLGFNIEVSHHEVAIGQHEIGFRHADALTCADNLTTFRYVVRSVAEQNGMHATFMPKPIFGQNGSGMHCNMSLSKAGRNTFFDPKGLEQLSDVALGYIAGLLDHLPGITALANPTVNSYKRLVPGYEAPVYIAWSPGNRSAAIRIPAKRGNSTRAELRTPDPTANPYLAFTVMLAAGLDGIKRGLKPPAPVNQNIYHLSEEESAKLKITGLPHNLSAAIDAFSRDKVLTRALGEHITEAFIAEKRAEWKDYQAQVHGWEIQRYMETF